MRSSYPKKIWSSVAPSGRSGTAAGDLIAPIFKFRENTEIQEDYLRYYEITMASAPSQLSSKLSFKKIFSKIFLKINRCLFFQNLPKINRCLYFFEIFLKITRCLFLIFLKINQCLFSKFHYYVSDKISQLSISISQNETAIELEIYFHKKFKIG